MSMACGCPQWGKGKGVNLMLTEGGCKNLYSLWTS